MTSQSPFLSAGIPGLTFGLSLGRGLSIQVDPTGTITEDTDDLNAPDEKSFIADTTIPNALLAVHFYALHNIQIDYFDFDLEDGENLHIYASFSLGSTKKASQQQPFENKASLVFNEIKYFPLEVTPIPNEHTNKLVVLVYICKEKDRLAVSQAEHRMIGRYEAHMHTLLKYVNGHETMSILSKKGVTVGKIEFEFGVTYGSFGYGQSYQLKNDMYTSNELAKISMLPRLFPPEGSVLFKGTSVYPRRLKHPPFIPLISEAVEDFEPENLAADSGSEQQPPPIECPNFPLMRQHMQRINSLLNIYSAQPSRTKRIYFLRKLLQDGVGAADEDFEEADDSDRQEAPAPIPASLAMMMNTHKFIELAPGIVQRKGKSERQSMPAAAPRQKLVSRPRAHSNPEVKDLDRMKDVMFRNRRMSIAPTQEAADAAASVFFD